MSFNVFFLPSLNSDLPPHHKLVWDKVLQWQYTAILLKYSTKEGNIDMHNNDNSHKDTATMIDNSTFFGAFLSSSVAKISWYTVHDCFAMYHRVTGLSDHTVIITCHEFIWFLPLVSSEIPWVFNSISFHFIYKVLNHNNSCPEVLYFVR